MGRRQKGIDIHSEVVALSPRRPAMFNVFSIGIALASSLLVPLAASAVPIMAANGVPESAPASPSGPRRPGLISPAAVNVDAASETTNRGGRPVPGRTNGTLSAAEDPRPILAESDPSRTPGQF